jgi:L-rhamnose mutarotase
MPWSVRLQEERGNPVTCKGAVIEFATISDYSGFKLLGYLDPYGDTYFNQYQMKDFLADWAKLTPSSEQREQWQVVHDMATRCRDEAHLYVRFIGD